MLLVPLVMCHYGCDWASIVSISFHIVVRICIRISCHIDMPCLFDRPQIQYVYLSAISLIEPFSCEPYLNGDYEFQRYRKTLRNLKNCWLIDGVQLSK